ncbi:MAG: metalloregulator ArsR/SmtB family transcription factor [Phyllobacteriaceae bacterium]|nr:metalloregulator ArsR/SmtB family transcription factor [Phyllobacteriaceae bacterium]
MDELLAGLKAIAETTRIRILFVLSHGELNVSELTYVLGQSQPRVSRHLKLMAEAGLLSRNKEGNWVLFRLRGEGVGGALARSLVDMLPGKDAVLSGDLARLEEVRRQREERAQAYFSANAAHWSNLRSLHVDEANVEQAMLQLVGAQDIGTLVDLGTGTGRVLELFGGVVRDLHGIDASREMLAIARANIEKHGFRRAELRQSDIYALPLADGMADLVTIHQVLHFLDEPQRALLEARRILRPGGKLLIVDFAPHELEELREEHAHRRLGISAEQMTAWFARAHLQLSRHLVLDPPWLKSRKGLTVSLWLAQPLAIHKSSPSVKTVSAK